MTQDGTVFELRTYHTPPGRLDALEARFRDHTVTLFARHEIVTIGFWRPTDGPGARTTLIYLLRHPSRAAAEEHWTAFRADPDWQAAKAASEVDGSLTTSIESVFLEATDFSLLT